MPENLCYLVAEGGQHLLYSERGELIQGVIKTHVIDDIDCVPVARVTMLVKLSSKEDMEKDVLKKAKEDGEATVTVRTACGEHTFPYINPDNIIIPLGRQDRTYGASNP